MGPQKRQRRGRVQRAVAPEQKTPTRRRRKGVEPDAGTTGPTEPQPKQPRKRRTRSGPVTPAWRVGQGNRPMDTEEETPDVAGD